MDRERQSPMEISIEEFKKTGYQLIDTIAGFINTIEKRPVTTGESQKQLQQILDTSSLPDNGRHLPDLLAASS